MKEYKYMPGSPKAIIVDIDGTLAHMGDRDPYDMTRILEDRVDYKIAKLVENYKSLGYMIIVMSGRPDSAKIDTATWLYNKGIDYDMLFMRRAGDKRKDAIAKQELFENNIAGHYNIEFVLDDRNQVVKMWRSLGLKCLQVEEGDF